MEKDLSSQNLNDDLKGEEKVPDLDEIPGDGEKAAEEVLVEEKITENTIPSEVVHPPEPTTDISEYVLPDITLPSMDFAEFHGKETVDDASSVTTGFSTTIMDQEQGFGYPPAGFAFRQPQRQQRQVTFGGEQQYQVHPHYQAIDQVFPSPNQEFAQGHYYPQEPQHVHHHGGYHPEQGHFQSPEYSQDHPQRPNYARPHFPPPPPGSPPYQQRQHSQPLVKQPPPGFQPRLDSRFNPIEQKQQPLSPEPRTSLHRQKQIEEKDIGVPPVTRYCCGLFRTKKKCKMICIPLLTVLSITIGLLIFFLYPRSVEITLHSSLYQTGDASLTGDFKMSNVRLSIPLFGNFTANSPNFIPYSGQVTLTGSLINPNDKAPARINGEVSTTLKSSKSVYTSPGLNNFQMLVTFTYTQTSTTYSKNALRQARFKNIDGDLQTLYLSCAPELIGVLPYPNRKPRTVTVRLEWKVDVLVSGKSGSLEKDLECPDGIMRMLKSVAEGLA